MAYVICGSICDEAYTLTDVFLFVSSKTLLKSHTTKATKYVDMSMDS